MTAPTCFGDRTGAGGHTELGEHTGEVALDRGLTDVEVAGDGGVVVTVGHRSKNFQFSWRGDVGVAPRSGYNSGNYPGIEGLVAGSDGPNGADQVYFGRILEDVSGGTALECRIDVDVVVEDGDDQHARAGLGSLDLAQDVESTRPGSEMDVEHHDVGFEVGDRDDRGVVIVGLTHHHDVVCCVENRTQPRPHDGVVIDDHDADHGAVPGPGRSGIVALM
ncbi:MAG TPA: hypothetical protein PKA87_10565, partial [Microthrixaceae bacterium]|nr:hypothetical protein [Microthrixaceae bacterium]